VPINKFVHPAGRIRVDIHDDRTQPPWTLLSHVVLYCAINERTLLFYPAVELMYSSNFPSINRARKALCGIVRLYTRCDCITFGVRQRIGSNILRARPHRVFSVLPRDYIVFLFPPTRYTILYYGLTIVTEIKLPFG
jgi:hypothetical protein